MSSVTLPQGTLHYLDAGPRDAPVIVFLHGLLVDGAVWREVVSACGGRFRCVVPDLPLGSHREGMRADAELSPDGVARLVADLLAALDLRDVTLVGNDSGGAVAQLVANAHAERVGRLVLTTCDAFEVFPPKLFWYLGLVARSATLAAVALKALSASPTLRRLPIAYGAVTKRRLDPELTARWIRPSATRADVRRDLLKFIEGIHPRVTMRASKKLASFEKPALVLWAREDRWFPLSLGERLAATLPNARLELVDDAWVFAQLDAPAAVARAIASFVDQNVSTSARASTMLSSIEQ